jgi:hypothetical protein
MQFLKGLWNTFKFGASCLLGPSLAVTIAALFGSAYLLAEATNIVEAKVRKDMFGGKSVGFNTFFKGISDGIRDTMVSAWTDYCAYAPIQAAKIVFEKTGRKVDFTALEKAKAEVVIPTAMAAATIIPLEAGASKDSEKIVVNPITNDPKTATTEANILNTGSSKSPPSTTVFQPVQVEQFLSPDKITSTTVGDSGVRSN